MPGKTPSSIGGVRSVPSLTQNRFADEVSTTWPWLLRINPSSALFSVASCLARIDVSLLAVFILVSGSPAVTSAFVVTTDIGLFDGAGKGCWVISSVGCSFPENSYPRSLAPRDIVILAILSGLLFRSVNSLT